MDLILPIIYSALFLLLIARMKFFGMDELSRIKLMVLFILKLAAAIAVWLTYTQHYESSDFHYYFTDSKIFIDHLFGDTSEKMLRWDSSFDPVIFNSSRTMIVVNAFFRIFSFGNIYVHIVFFCFFSFLGLVGLYKSFCRTFPRMEIRLLIAIFLVPTVLFWGSAPLKEAMVIGVTGLLVYASDFGLKLRVHWWQVIIILLLFALLFFVKLYVALAILPVMLVNSIVSATSMRLILFKYLSVILVLSILAFYATVMNPDYNMLRLISDKQAKAISEAKGGVFLVNASNFICVDHSMKEKVLIPVNDSAYRIKEGSNFLSWRLDNMRDTTFVTHSSDSATYKILYEQTPANSIIELKKMEPDLQSFILYAPAAAFSVLIHPTVFENTSWMHLAVAVENLWILLVALLAIIFFDRKCLERKDVLLFSFVFSMILFVLIGFTVPALGAMVRYRTIGLLFFVPMCVVMIDENKIKKLLNRQSTTEDDE